MERIRAVPDHEELETILALFAMIRLSVETVEQLLRWDMSVLEKSPLYEEILKRSFQKGLDEAITAVDYDTFLASLHNLVKPD